MFCSSTTVLREPCYVFMASLHGFMLLQATCKSTTMQREHIVAFCVNSGYSNAQQDCVVCTYIANPVMV